VVLAADLLLDWPVLGMLSSLLPLEIPNKNQSRSKETHLL
jgi:hypothetical protein